MPNHVNNTLTVIGPGMDAFASAVHKQAPLSGPGDCNYQEEPDLSRKPLLLSFGGTVPLDPKFSTESYSAYGQDEERRKWGVKWGAYDVVREYNSAKKHLKYEFQTAWSAPVEWVIKSSRLFPKTVFYLSWGGEGPVSGRAVICDGDCLFLEDMSYDELVDAGLYTEIDWDNLTPEEEEAACEREDTVTMRFIDSHDEWIHDEWAKKFLLHL